MRFTIVNSMTRPPVIYFDFQPPGGTIGRSVDNDLVLPDEKRAISRLQALVHISAETHECRLTNRGSVTPVLLNDVPLERGQQVLLHDSDLLSIGYYQVRVNSLDTQDPITNDICIDPLSLFQQPALMQPDPLGISHPDPTPPEPQKESSHAGNTVSPTLKNNQSRLNIDPLPGQRTYTMEEPHYAHPGDKMVQALFEGMGLNSDQNFTPITEEQMRMTGRLLQLFSQGTVALLSSRSILKRGVKAEMTMILNEANNPFKILPSGKTVLMQMYQSQMPGFMPPEQAVRDAMVDLQAHQLGMIAGIRAIIAAMLQAFNPRHLEDNARRAGALPKIGLSIRKKAAMWDFYTRNYQQTVGEIEDDFHTFFGEAFLHAYDMEVNQYKESQTKAETE